VKGPHASLAVRLSQRDPDKKWLLGERLPYVLLTGVKQLFDVLIILLCELVLMCVTFKSMERVAYMIW
jgi:hypothetical protein